MKTIQMTLDEALVKSVDQAAKSLHTTRSAFTREALRQALRTMRIRKLEEKHRTGYALHPPTEDELNVWEHEQKWGDD